MGSRLSDLRPLELGNSDAAPH